MSYRGVFLDKVHANVRKKLDYLQANAKVSGSRVNRDEELQTPWIKLTSNADSCDPKFPVAKDYIMYSDLRDLNDSAKSHKRLESWKDPVGGKPGGGLYGSNHLNRPVPVIEGITVSNKGALGSIRTATIKGTIYAESDLKWFEKLYMQPGITLLLEWGHSNTDVSPIILTDDTRPADVAKMILKKTLQSDDFGTTDKDPDITSKQIKDVGTYDAMLGVIIKFNWTNGAQGYDFSVDIISPNSIMNSFDMSTSSLGAKVTTKTTVNDSSKKGNAVDNKNSKSKNVVPLDDIEGMLTHLSAMGMTVASEKDTQNLKRGDSGTAEEMGDKPLGTDTAVVYKTDANGELVLDENNQPIIDVEADTTVADWEADIAIVRKTSKTVSLAFDDQNRTLPYDFIRPVAGRPTVVRNAREQVVGWTGRVPNNETFGTGKDDEMKLADVKLGTFISWRFLEELITWTMPDSTKAAEKDKKLVRLQSTTLQKDGNYYANQIFGHPDLCSVNRGVCMLAGAAMTPFKFERGDFKPYFPTWTGKEKFIFLNTNRLMSNTDAYGKWMSHFIDDKVGAGGGMGNLSGLLLNVDFVLQTYRQNKSTLNKFIYALLGGVNAACGNPWDFHIQNNPNDPSKMAVVDLRVTENADKIRAEIRGEGSQLTYKFQTQLGILRSINMSSKLPKAVASAAYVASAAANAGDYDDAGFNLYQEDPKYPIFDGLSIKNSDRGTKCKTDDKDEEKPEEVLDGPGPEFDMKMSLWKAIVFGKDIGSAQSKMADYIRKIVLQPTPDNPNWLPAIPVELSFQLDGISGLYMGNAIVMDTISDGGILPDRYKNNVAFQVSQVSHTVNSNGWDTDVTCMMRMTQSKKDLVDRKYIQIERKAVEDEVIEPTPGANGPPSSKKESALHPQVQEDYAKIKQKLEALGWQPKIVTAFRSLEEQHEKLTNGKSQTAYGYHCFLAEDGSRASQALDLIDARYSYGNSPKSIREIGQKATEDQARLFWGDLGKIAESSEFGYRWGGKFGSNGSAYYDFSGSPSDNLMMGWDPGHIDKKGNGLPSSSQARRNASEFFKRPITNDGPNVI